ncbi:MAG: hypothetical protein P8Y91_08165 [Desulfuromonadales bacterium]
MLRLCLAGFFCLVLGVSSAGAVDIAATPSLVFSVPVPSGWTLHVKDPPAELVRETASHIAHEPGAENATPAQVNAVARKRLLENEAILYHAASGAHLDIDFSPLAAGESPPGNRTLKNSAKYAAESLKSESDVSDVAWQVTDATIPGASSTYLLLASYRKHEQPMIFRGYIGFAGNAWFFLYLTAPADATDVLRQGQQIIDEGSIQMVPSAS